MKNSFSEVLQGALMSEASKIAKSAGTTVSDMRQVSEMMKRYKEQSELIRDLMLGSPSVRDLPKIGIREAMHSTDASILFPRAISDVLLRPREPLMIGQQYLARTIQVDNVQVFSFPVLGAIRAFDMAEGQEYPEQLTAFAQHFTEVRVNKVGLKIDVAEEVIADSMWDILGLYVEAAGYAMQRHKEEKIFNTALSYGHVVFDNNVNDPDFWTHGMGVDGNHNYTLHFDDLVDAVGALVAHEYVPTDIVMHPLGWVVWVKDPVLRAQFLHGGQVGQSVWSTPPQFDQNVNMPWNMNYVVTPFTSIRLRTKLTGHTGNTGLKYPNPNSLPNAHITDVMILDRNQAIIVLQREAMTMDNYENWLRDTRMMKFRERYGVAALNQGRALALIKNIRLDTNFAPIMTIRTVSPS